jgi:DNA polymerase
MNPGFFSTSTLDSKAPQSLIPKCGACGIYKTCGSPKLPPVGEGRKKVLIISEAPSGRDDDAGRFLSDSKSSLPLESALRKCGVDILRDCWLTSALICHTNGKSPTSDQIGYCRPNLIKTINTLQPNVIIPLGGSAINSIIPHVWKENIGMVGRWFGWQIPCQKLNAWICPTHSPIWVNHAINNDHMNAKTLKINFNKHITQALRLDEKPWNPVPDYRKEITLIREPKKAANQIRKMIELGGPVAFDYETDRIKPDSDDSRIVTCSVCWKGKRTIAYPWHGEAITATKELLRSPLPKIGCNLKFEDRWTRKHMGHRVRNWYWDTMLAAHVIDGRPGVTSIKFQSFVLLGQDSYDGHIKQFFQSVKGEERNQIDLVDVDDLLLYNGLDSLLQYKVAMKQMDLLEYPRP